MYGTLAEDTYVSRNCAHMHTLITFLEQRRFRTERSVCPYVRYISVQTQEIMNL